jgi:crotonobetainyl-CoA:carnitine CoA-transferase CaiB-like acyl-CoA transferase
MHKYSGLPAQAARSAPLLGQHNDEVYRGELGLPDGKLGELRVKGII